jgi:hypothetical protein
LSLCLLSCVSSLKTKRVASERGGEKKREEGRAQSQTMDSFERDNHGEPCAICLESLLPKTTSSASSTTTSSLQVKIGAIVPCGHVFHSLCYKKWHAAHKERRQRIRASNTNTTDNTQDTTNNDKCQCPMCNLPCDDFVKLFLGGDSDSSRHSRAVPAAATAIAAPAGEGEEENESILLLARTCHDSAKRLDRVKDKLNRYKKENSSLKKKLEEERRQLDSVLERTVERHAKERRSWKRQQHRMEEETAQKERDHEIVKQELAALKEEMENERRKWKKHSKKLEQKLLIEMESNNDERLTQVQEWRREKMELKEDIASSKAETETLRGELERTIVLQVEERRNCEQQQRELQERAVKSEGRVAKAVQGIAQMKAFHYIRKDQVAALKREKALLLQQVQGLQEAADLEEEEVIFG